MIKTILIFCLIFITYAANAQFFDWAASASGMDIRYQFSSVDKDNNLVVGGPLSITFMHNYRDVAPELYDGKGQVRDSLYPEDETNIVVSYSSDGSINWNIIFDNRFSDLLGITHNYLDQTVLLVKTDDRFSGEDDLGRIPEIGYEGYNIPNGYYLLFYDKKGKFIKKSQTLIGNKAKLDLSGFQSYPKGGYVITGFIEKGKIADSISIISGPAGGDLLLVLNEDGSAKWADVISYDDTSCCGYFADMCEATVSKNGTIYFAGTLAFNALIGQGGKKITLNNETQQDGFSEVYLASYSKTGSLNWVTTSQSRAIFSTINQNDKGVYLACKFNDSNNKLFNTKVDTNGGKNWVVTGFNFKGKALWNASSKIKSINTLVSDQENNLYIAGETLWNGMIGKDSITKQLDTYIASFAYDGTFRWSKLSSIPLVTNSDEYLKLYIDNCGNIFLVGTLFFSLPVEINRWDKAFIRGNAYGAAPFIARFKNTLPQLKNTSPDIVQKEESFCTISPGPWKLYNYPNPFNERTKIVFELTYDDIISLKIFNMSGELIQELVTERPYKKGKHEVDYSNINLTSGSYQVVLTGSEMIESSTIILGR